jgi:hypothetical protein
MIYGWLAFGALVWLLLEIALFHRVHPWSLVLLCAMGLAVVIWGDAVMNSWPRFKGR